MATDAANAASNDREIVELQHADLSTLLNVVSVAIARGQVSRHDATVRDAYARARETLDG